MRKKFNLNVELIIGIVNKHVGRDTRKNTKTRKRHIVEARQMCQYFLYMYTKKSLAEIGRMFEKDHATVLHAVKTMRVLSEVDPQIRNLYVDIDMDLKKNMSIVKDYVPTVGNLVDDLMQTKKLNSDLIHRAINLKERIHKLPQKTLIKYFGDDKYICTPEQEDIRVGVVR